MFRAIIMLDCDRCHDPFWKSATAVEHDEEIVGVTWEDATKVLMSWALDAGWDLHRQFYVCPDCFRDRDDRDEFISGLSLHHTTP